MKCFHLNWFPQCCILLYHLWKADSAFLIITHITTIYISNNSIVYPHKSIRMLLVSDLLYRWTYLSGLWVCISGNYPRNSRKLLCFPSRSSVLVSSWPPPDVFSLSLKEHCQVSHSFFWVKLAALISELGLCFHPSMCSQRERPAPGCYYSGEKVA